MKEGYKIEIFRLIVSYQSFFIRARQHGSTNVIRNQCDQYFENINVLTKKKILFF